MYFYHDSHSEAYRSPLGAAPCESKVRLRVNAQGLSMVTLRVWLNNEEYRVLMNKTQNDLYEYELLLPKKPGLVWYYFIAMDENRDTWYLGNASDNQGGIGMCTRHEPESYQITTYDPKFDTPDWMRNGIVMQIMVDRFANSGGVDVRNLPAGSYYHAVWDDDPALVINDKRGNLTCNDLFGGNLRGIEDKLGYIKSLGVSVIYLNPIFKANSNHKYNTGDYMQIDPSFGTEEDFKRLCRKAEKEGIRIVLDGVFSHTGSDSVYFDRYGTYGGHGAYNDPDSKYASWYRFYEWPDVYECWWGFKTLPNVNEDDPSYRKFIISGKDSVMTHWLKAGASGWRLDVADELPMDFIREMRKYERKTKKDSCLIGEVWEDPSNKVSYGEIRCYCTGDTLDATMNYPLRDAVLNFMLCRINAPQLVRSICSMRENQPKPFFYSQMNLLSSHDRPRALTVLADIGNMEPDRKYRYPLELQQNDYERGRRRLIAAWKIMCALPGMPTIYYGDEAGLYGMSDPYCRGTYPWGHEDDELLASFRKTSQARKESQAMKTGDMRIYSIGEDVMIVERFIENGEDVFGKAYENEHRAFAFNRCGESRWIEYNGKTVEVPAESGIELK